MLDYTSRVIAVVLLWAAMGSDWLGASLTDIGARARGAHTISGNDTKLVRTYG